MDKVNKLSRIFSIINFKNTSIIYDPCSGRSVIADKYLGEDGRIRLSPSIVSSQPNWDEDRNINFIPSICWSPLVACNLDCPHCLDDKSLSESNSATRHKIAKLLSISNILGIDISGGEPLLIRDLVELLSLLRKGKSAVSITTNGWFLEQKAEFLAPVVDAIRVSLDGGTALDHDRLRGKGSFSKALSGIRKSVELAIPLQVQTVAMASSFDKIRDIFSLANDEGVQGVTVLQMLPIGEGYKLSTELLGDDLVEKYIESVDEFENIDIWVRTREYASQFTVIRADGRIWRNNIGALSIKPYHHLTEPSDLFR